tara:strand:+ start:70747 stop:72330 length:1584 start_codon:yes stop_codon:yes gene_type:complete
LHDQLQAIAALNSGALLKNLQRGIEKESLRISTNGKLAQTPHPRALGSALTHSSITTDYSEALLEFITPVSNSIEDSLNTLQDIHSFVYQQLDDELLWAASMPCIVAGDDGIPVARYGSSNVARMKTVYRYGLGHRYGRLMQTIAGIHYNFSMPQAYWQNTWEQAGSPGELQDYISERYLGLIRNFKRYSWLLIYLFGASPAVCSTFLKGRDNHGLQPFDEQGRSLYLPYGTALRMGGLGYNSDAQKDLNICYNSLDNYVNTLKTAILQPHPEYRPISSNPPDYQQLSPGLLQIENEFYSPIRPKRVAKTGETPLNALVRAGIEYIEVRCIDVSPFTPVGLDETQIRFLDTFLLYCLMLDSPPCEAPEQQQQVDNLEAVVSRGRESGLMLATPEGAKSLTDWGTQLLQAMSPVAASLDSAHGAIDNVAAYAASLDQQQAKITDPELTPSARILREMREQDLPFFRVAMQYSERWAEHFRQRRLDDSVQAAFNEERERSFQAQRDIETADSISFEQYLDQYFSQYKAL